MVELQLPFLDCPIYVYTDDMNIAESVCFIYKENAFINNRNPGDGYPIVRIKKDGVNMYTVGYRKYCINTASPYIKVQACMSLSCFASGYGDPCFLGQEPWFSGCRTALYSAYCHDVGSFDVTACDPMNPPTAPHGVNNIIDPL